MRRRAVGCVGRRVARAAPFALALAIAALCACNGLLGMDPPTRRAAGVEGGADGAAPGTTGTEAADAGERGDSAKVGDSAERGNGEDGGGPLDGEAGAAGWPDGPGDGASSRDAMPDAPGDATPPSSDAGPSDASPTVAVAPSISLAVDPPTARVVRGQAVSVQVTARRQPAFIGPVGVVAAGLPSGVTADPVGVSPDDVIATLTFHASPTSTLGAASVSIRALIPTPDESVTLKLIVQDPPGRLDATFGTGGRFLMPITGGQNIGFGGVWPQADGSTLLCGNGVSGSGLATGSVLLARLLDGGMLDPTFGSAGSGIVFQNATGSSTDVCFSMFTTADGSIVASGFEALATGNHAIMNARFTSAGLLDPTFGSGGFVTTNLGLGDAKSYCAFGPLDDAGFIVGGFVAPDTEDPVFVRYAANGALNPNFGAGGVFRPPVPGAGVVNWIGRQSTGTLVAAVLGAGFEVMALAPAGVLDTNFASGTGFLKMQPPGYASSLSFVSLVRPEDDAILLVGTATIDSLTQDIAVARLSASGVLDVSFGQGGWGFAHFAGGVSSVRSAALAADGSIVVAGQTPTAEGEAFTVVRFTAGGAPDLTFGPQGRRTFEADGSALGTFDESDLAQGVALDALGRIVVAGRIYAASEARGIVAYRLWP